MLFAHDGVSCRLCADEIDLPRRNVAMRKKSSTNCDSTEKLSFRYFRCELGSLRPEVIEDESRDDNTEENSNHAIANVIEIGIGRVALEEAVKERERDL